MRRTAASVSAALAMLASVASPSFANAQAVPQFALTPPSTGPQIVRLGDRGDPPPFGGAPSSVWTEPLRLALTDLPTAPLHGGCESRSPAFAAPGFTSRASTMPTPFVLHSLSPRLTLFGFSQWGCPSDSAAGGGIAHGTQLGKDAWLVLSAAARYAPQSLLQRTQTDVRATVVFPSPSKRHGTSVGIGTRGLSFGGVW